MADPAYTLPPGSLSLGQPAAPETPAPTAPSEPSGALQLSEQDLNEIMQEQPMGAPNPANYAAPPEANVTNGTQKLQASADRIHNAAGQIRTQVEEGNFYRQTRDGRLIHWDPVAHLRPAGTEPAPPQTSFPLRERATTATQAGVVTGLGAAASQAYKRGSVDVASVQLVVGLAALAGWLVHNTPLHRWFKSQMPQEPQAAGPGNPVYQPTELPPEIVEHFNATTPGWQAYFNEARAGYLRQPQPPLYPAPHGAPVQAQPTTVVTRQGVGPWSRTITEHK